MVDPLVQGAIFLAIAGLWSVFVAKVLGPWAWARAVDNPKSKASKVLARVLKETRDGISTDARAAIATELKGYKPDFSGLALSVDFESEAAQQGMARAIRLAQAQGRAANARDAKDEQAGEITDADMQVIATAGSMAEHPEQAQMAAGLIQMISLGVDTGMINEKRGAKTIGKIQDALARGKNLQGTYDQITKLYPTLAAGAGGGSKGSGGLTPLG